MKKILYICAAVAAVGLVALLIFWLLNPGDKNDEKIDDDTEILLDLDNFVIADLTNEQIASTSGSCKVTEPHFERSGSNSGITDIKFADEDRDKTHYTAKKITGIKTVSATLVKDCTIKLDIDSEVISGNAEVVILIDDIVFERINANVDKTFKYDVVGEHTFYVRIICEDAQIDIEVEREFVK